MQVVQILFTPLVGLDLLWMCLEGDAAGFDSPPLDIFQRCENEFVLGDTLIGSTTVLIGSTTSGNSVAM